MGVNHFLPCSFLEKVIAEDTDSLKEQAIRIENRVFKCPYCSKNETPPAPAENSGQ